MSWTAAETTASAAWTWPAELLRIAKRLKLKSSRRPWLIAQSRDRLRFRDGPKNPNWAVVESKWIHHLNWAVVESKWIHHPNWAVVESKWIHHLNWAVVESKWIHHLNWAVVGSKWIHHSDTFHSKYIKSSSECGMECSMYVRLSRNVTWSKRLNLGPRCANFLHTYAHCEKKFAFQFSSKSSTFLTFIFIVKYSNRVYLKLHTSVSPKRW